MENYMKHLYEKCIVFCFFLKKLLFTQTYNLEFCCCLEYNVQMNNYIVNI